MPDATDQAEAASAPPGQYVVIARRYRPQRFEDLIGQEHVAQALSNAIATHRVGHAYLFTGARGVGKTSSARILAKALNCEHGPTPTPCNRCDVCLSISTGEDVDVLEIDGASNRGIDEIRQLRQNVNIRPTRSRFKIYIIDEVHMLTREAFNALLKTLEEPPEHVKFIFCTTEPTKIPITILSRCQRFDFAGILTSAIVQRLKQITDSEGVEAEGEALEVLARRAAGSMRDSQSLLEQLLAFAPGKITLADVHGMLGTAGDERLTALLGHVVERQPAAALAELDTALREGVDPALLLEQLFGYLRDCMAAAIGCPGETMLYASPTGRQVVAEAGRRLGLTTILAAMQVVEQALSRLRYSTQGRILAELALVRMCHLEELDDLPEVIAQLRAGSTGGGATPLSVARTSAPAESASTVPPVPTSLKKKPELASDPAAVAVESTVAGGVRTELTPDSAPTVWSQALGRLSGLVAEQARQCDRVAIAGPDRLAVTFKGGYAFAKATCEQPEQISRFEAALAEVTGRPIRVEFRLEAGGAGAAAPGPEPPRPVPQHQRLLALSKHPLIQRATELFGAQPLRVEDPVERT